MKSLTLYRSDMVLNNIILAVGDRMTFYKDKFGAMSTYPTVHPSVLSPLYYIPLNIKEVK